MNYIELLKLRRKAERGKRRYARMGVKVNYTITSSGEIRYQTAPANRNAHVKGLREQIRKALKDDNKT